MREFNDTEREYSDDEVTFDPEAVERERQAEEEERMRRRIRREIIRVNQGERDEELEAERERMAEEEREKQEAEEREKRNQRSIVKNLATGNFLTSEGAQQYYPYLIAIAAMCFFSIFLTLCRSMPTVSAASLRSVPRCCVSARCLWRRSATAYPRSTR